MGDALLERLPAAGVSLQTTAMNPGGFGRFHAGVKRF